MIGKQVTPEAAACLYRRYDWLSRQTSTAEFCGQSNSDSLRRRTRKAYTEWRAAYSKLTGEKD